MGASVRRPKPFTPARKVFVSRAQSQDAGDNVTEEDVAQLLEGESSDSDVGEELGAGITLDALVMNETDGDDADDEADILMAVKVAEEFTALYDDHAVLESVLKAELKAQVDAIDEVEGLEEEADGDVAGGVTSEEDKEQAKVVDGAASAAFERLLTAASASNDDEDTLMAFAGSDEPLEVEEVQDFQGPRGFRKYDEQETSGVSEEERAAMAEAKLTKEELANLVPEDWDTINVDWFSSKKEDNISLPEYKLNFIWTEKNIAVAVDQVYSRGQVSPLTEYFFWPRKDAWDELRMALEARPWIPERDKVILLNRTTEVINTWQVEGDVRPSLEAVRADFPDCSFMGTSTPAAAPPPPVAYDQEMAMSA